MRSYLNNLITEKNLDWQHTFEVEGKEWGINFIPLEVVVEHILIAPEEQQKEIKNTLVKIDFYNGDVLHFFNHLAKAIAR